MEFNAMAVIKYVITMSVLLFYVTVDARLSKLSSRGCDFKGDQVCHGAVTTIGKSVVKVCEDGVWRYRASYLSTKRDNPVVGKDTGKGKDCNLAGKVFCSGDLIEDKG